MQIVAKEAAKHALHQASSHQGSAMEVSSANLMQNMESFGNLGTMATRNLGGAQESSSPNDSSQYLQVQSRHFNLTTPSVAKNKSEMAYQRLHQGLPAKNSGKPRKEVFFRSGRGQGLHRMTLAESRSGEVRDVTDLKNLSVGTPGYLQQINEKPLEKMLQYRRKRSEDT